MDNSRLFPGMRTTGERVARSAREGRIRLSAGECWTPRPLSQITLLCTHGTFWWTQPGDGRDHLLRPGQRVTVASRSRIVLQALTGAELVVEGTA